MSIRGMGERQIHIACEQIEEDRWSPIVRPGHLDLIRAHLNDVTLSETSLSRTISFLKLEAACSEDVKVKDRSVSVRTLSSSLINTSIRQHGVAITVLRRDQGTHCASNRSLPSSSSLWLLAIDYLPWMVEKHTKAFIDQTLLSSRNMSPSTKIIIKHSKSKSRS
ncbi:hypothetical protein MRB53_038831 [Persea americana]|nr:hypothetical protein MRB53_038831 [Persea americana]